MPSSARATVPLAAVVAAWLLAVCGGLAFLASHANRPGAVGVVPSTWPAGSRLERATDRATLVVGLHPGCPCSRATVEELDRLMARGHERVTVHALVLKPSGFAERWEETDVWRALAAIPGVRLHRDVDGVESDRFGAATSGQVALYDADGRLAFSGGITASRGHVGDNAGAEAIGALLDGAPRVAALRQTPVFGCALHDDVSAKGEAR